MASSGRARPPPASTRSRPSWRTSTAASRPERRARSGRSTGARSKRGARSQAGSAPWRAAQRSKRLAGAAGGDRLGHRPHGSRGWPASRATSSARAKVTSIRSSGPSPARASSDSRTSAAWPAQRPSGWLMSVTRQEAGVPRARAVSTRPRASSSERSSSGRKAPLPVLTSKTTAAAAGGELLRQDAGGDQRDRVDGGGDVAQGVEAAVGGSDLAGGAADRHAAAGEQVEAAGAVEPQVHPGDALQLVDGAAGMAEAAAGEHEDRQAAARRAAARSPATPCRRRRRSSACRRGGGPRGPRSQRSPESRMARVSARVSSASRPRMAAAIRKAASCPSLQEPSAAPRRHRSGSPRPRAASRRACAPGCGTGGTSAASGDGRISPGSRGMPRAAPAPAAAAGRIERGHLLLGFARGRGTAGTRRGSAGRTGPPPAAG